MNDEHFVANRRNWDKRAAVHAVSADYDLAAFHADPANPAHLSDVVRFDRPRLGDIAGLDVVRLQCRIGTDTLSHARLGANVSGIDRSRTSRRDRRSPPATGNVVCLRTPNRVYVSRTR